MQSTMEEISRIKEITSNVKYGCLTKIFGNLIQKNKQNTTLLGKKDTQKLYTDYKFERITISSIYCLHLLQSVVFRE